MRAARYVVLAAAGIACIGLSVFLSAKPKPTDSSATIGFAPPKHPVTEKMTREAGTMALKPAPSYERTSVQGEKETLSGTALARPQFVLFILDTCPCSVDAQPIFNGFAKHWAGKVDFLGVINADGKIAKTWVDDYNPIFPVLPDSKKEIIKAYGAKQSVYGALISRDGKIVKLWPGYSIDMLKEMNETMAKEVGETARAFDTQYAPKDKTSGCFF